MGDENGAVQQQQGQVPLTADGYIQSMSVTHIAAPGEQSPLGWMFPKLREKPCKLTPENLRLLAQVMTAEKDEPLQENQKIAAGYTYLGQFINHDISVNTKSIVRDRQIQPKHTGTPCLDLDAVYGIEPDAWPELYEPEGRDAKVKFRIADTIGSGEDGVRDLFRADWIGDDASKRPAVIGDSRNDENHLIAQLHSSFIDFHNAMVEHVRDQRPELSGLKLLGYVRDQVRWHYQWIVLWDYLPRLCGGAAHVKSVVDIVHRKGRLPRYRPTGRAFVPLEFWGAAFRVGHSMSRPSYFLNDQLSRPGQSDAPIKVREPIPLLDVDSTGPNADLRGHVVIPKGWGISWKYFFPFSGARRMWAPHASEAERELQGWLPGPQPSLKISHEITSVLSKLPPEILKGAPFDSLVELDLLTGAMLGLPSGQSIAEAVTGRKDHLTPEELQVTPADRKKLRDRGLPEELPESLLNDTPLFYYLLKEAEVMQGGLCLGPVGRTILVETLVGILRHNENTILNNSPYWRPFAGAIPGEPYTMAHFLSFAFKYRETRPAGPWLCGVPVMA